MFDLQFCKMKFIFLGFDYDTWFVQAVYSTLPFEVRATISASNLNDPC